MAKWWKRESGCNYRAVSGIFAAVKRQRAVRII
jgi:hypothetical protein